MLMISSAIFKKYIGITYFYRVLLIHFSLAVNRTKTKAAPIVIESHSELLFLRVNYFLGKLTTLA